MNRVKLHAAVAKLDDEVHLDDGDQIVAATPAANGRVSLLVASPLDGGPLHQRADTGATVRVEDPGLPVMSAPRGQIDYHQDGFSQATPAPDPEPHDIRADYPGVSRDTDVRLLVALRRAGDEWGPLGVAIVAAQMSSPSHVIDALRERASIDGRRIDYPREEVPDDVAAMIRRKLADRARPTPEENEILLRWLLDG